MSPALATVIVLMLGLPVIAFVAAGAAVGINPGIYTGAIGFVAGVGFIVGALLEIYRLVAARSEDLVGGWMSQSLPRSASPISPPAADKVERTRVEVIRESTATDGESGRIARAA